MTYREAIIQIKNLNTPDPTANAKEKAEAIHVMMNMGTHNSVTKQDLLRCVRWLWENAFAQNEEGNL